jgi:hypothetical protein
MNLNGGLNFDVRSMKILFEMFERKSFLDIIDNYTCNVYYMQLIEECRVDKRIEDMK